MKEPLLTLWLCLVPNWFLTGPKRLFTSGTIFAAGTSCASVLKRICDVIFTKFHVSIIHLLAMIEFCMLLTFNYLLQARCGVISQNFLHRMQCVKAVNSLSSGSFCSVLKQPSIEIWWQFSVTIYQQRRRICIPTAFSFPVCY